MLLKGMSRPLRQKRGAKIITFPRNRSGLHHADEKTLIESAASLQSSLQTGKRPAQGHILQLQGQYAGAAAAAAQAHCNDVHMIAAPGLLTD